MLNGKYAYDYLHYLSDPRLDVTTMYVDNHYRQQEVYFSAVNGFSFFDWWKVNLSADFQWNTLDADLVDFAYPQRYSVLTALATSIQFEKFSMQASLLHTYIYDKTKALGEEAPEKSQFTPTVVMSYRPWSAENLQLRAFYKRIFRMPTFNDLYYTFIGNKQLKPEFTTQYDVGIVYNKSFGGHGLTYLDVSVDGYFNQVDDKIIAMPTSNQFQWTMVNLGYVEIRGIDASIQSGFQFGKVALNARLNYTYQKAQDFTDPESQWYGGQILISPGTADRPYWAAAIKAGTGITALSIPANGTKRWPIFRKTIRNRGIPTTCRCPRVFSGTASVCGSRPKSTIFSISSTRSCSAIRCPGRTSKSKST